VILRNGALAFPLHKERPMWGNSPQKIHTSHTAFTYKKNKSNFRNITPFRSWECKCCTNSADFSISIPMQRCEKEEIYPGSVVADNNVSVVHYALVELCTAFCLFSYTNDVVCFIFFNQNSIYGGTKKIIK